MTTPFSAALEILRNHECRDIAEANMVRQAINVLEAAGKVDKERAVKYMSNIGVGAYETDGESPYTPGDKQAASIRALLAALPEEVK